MLMRAGVEDTALMLVGNHLHWLGHICRVDDDRPVKAFLFCELFHGSRPVGRPCLRLKDTFKKTLKFGNVLDVTADKNEEGLFTLFVKVMM